MGQTPHSEHLNHISARNHTQFQRHIVEDSIQCGRERRVRYSPCKTQEYAVLYMHAYSSVWGHSEGSRSCTLVHLSHRISTYTLRIIFVVIWFGFWLASTHTLAHLSFVIFWQREKTLSWQTIYEL
uniref:Uncharacterized protein n=1 Tax=Glossina austeni TaxID=7395 RepID=A0A1A9VS32_GLOAU